MLLQVCRSPLGLEMINYVWKEILCRCNLTEQFSPLEINFKCNRKHLRVPSVRAVFTQRSVFLDWFKLGFATISSLFTDMSMSSESAFEEDYSNSGSVYTSFLSSVVLADLLSVSFKSFIIFFKQFWRFLNLACIECFAIIDFKTIIVSTTNFGNKFSTLC